MRDEELLRNVRNARASEALASKREAAPASQRKKAGTLAKLLLGLIMAVIYGAVVIAVLLATAYVVSNGLAVLGIKTGLLGAGFVLVSIMMISDAWHREGLFSSKAWERLSGKKD